MSALKRATPESQGLPSAAISAFLTRLEAHELHSVMVLRHGHVIAEGWWTPYQRDLPHMMYSVSKSFTATAIGFAVQEGLLKVSDRVLPDFPDHQPQGDLEKLEKLTIKDLLTMSAGHDGEPQPKSEDWIKDVLNWPIKDEPGSTFMYNTPATYLAGAILQRKTGQTLVEYLTPRLFEPLGIQSRTWETDPKGLNVAGWGLYLQTEELALWGQFMLQKGQCEGQQRLSESWIAEMTAAQISSGQDQDNDWNQGYGYQVWRCRHNAYRADGAFGQFCVVMPDQDALVVMTAGEAVNTAGMLNAIWEELLPHFSAEALPENPQTQAALGQQLDALSLKGPESTTPSENQSHLNQTFTFEKNDWGLTSLTLRHQAGETTLEWTDTLGLQKIPVQADGWTLSESHLFQHMMWILQNLGPWPVAAQGGWTSEDTFSVRVCLVQTPFTPTITLHFEEDRVSVDLKGAVHFGPLERPLVWGKAEG